MRRLLGEDSAVGRLASPIQGTASVAIFALVSLSSSCISEMVLRCYACTHPSSTTPPRKFFDSPATAALAMHEACFMELAGHMVTQATLSQLLINWRFMSRCNKQHRRREVMTSVRRWQRELWEPWVEHCRSVTTPRFLCRRIFSMWWRVAVGIPNLVGSESDADDDMLTLVRA